MQLTSWQNGWGSEDAPSVQLLRLVGTVLAVGVIAERLLSRDFHVESHANRFNAHLILLNIHLQLSGDQCA